MKLISLNTWGGRGGKDNLLDFFKKYKEVDIFCLQEIWNGGDHMSHQITGGVVLKNIAYKLLLDISQVLDQHNFYFRPHFGDWYGLAVFIKKDLKVVEEGDRYVYKEKGWADSKDKGNHARNIQWVHFESSSSEYSVINFHGLWNGFGKNDSEDRLLQSDNILKFISEVSVPYVLCGDFNLRPDTVSLKKFEKAGLRNLIQEFGVTSTRTSLYTREEKFADYTFVDSKIKVNDFKVLPEEVSDHAAMYLEFD